jgi:MerR family transcriptional regulator, heat shock protein HspR
LTTPANSYPIGNPKHLAKYTMAITVMMTGVAAHKLRKLEEYGLCNPFRTGSKQRLYSDRDIELICKISTFEKKGVNLPGIKVILGIKPRQTE